MSENYRSVNATEDSNMIHLFEGKSQANKLKQKFIEVLYKYQIIDLEMGINTPRKIKFTLIGSFSSGKTTLLNKLIGKNFFPTNITAETSIPVITSYTEKNLDSFIGYIEGEDPVTLQADDVSKNDQDKMYQTKYLKAEIANSWLDNIKTIEIVDMPGLDSGYSSHNAAIESEITKADIYGLVISAGEGNLKESIKSAIYEYIPYSRPVVVILTKCDTKTEEDVKLISESIVDSVQREKRINLIGLIKVSSRKDQIDDIKEFLCELNKLTSCLVNLFFIELLITKIPDLICKLQLLRTDMKTEDESDIFENIRIISGNITEDYDSSINHNFKLNIKENLVEFCQRRSGVAIKLMNSIISLEEDIAKEVEDDLFNMDKNHEKESIARKQIKKLTISEPIALINTGLETNVDFYMQNFGKAILYRTLNEPSDKVLIYNMKTGLSSHRFDFIIDHDESRLAINEEGTFIGAFGWPKGFFKSMKHYIEIFNISNNSKIAKTTLEIGRENEVNSIIFSPEGDYCLVQLGQGEKNYLYSKDGKTRLDSIRRRNEIKEAVFIKKPDTMIMAVVDNAELLFIDLELDKITNKIPLAHDYNSYYNFCGLTSNKQKNKIIVYNASNVELIDLDKNSTISIPISGASKICINPDGSCFAAAGDKHNIDLYLIENNEEIRKVGEINADICILRGLRDEGFMAYDDTGKRLVYSGWSNVFCVNIKN